MIDIYILKTSECKDTLISLVPNLSPRRQKLYNGLLIKDSKLLNIGSEVLLAYALSLPLPCEYQTDKNDKPFISGQKYFNISHSGDFVVCAVCENEVGVDVEKIERMSPRLMHKFLSDEEIAVLNGLNESDIPYYLCEKWVRKESYLKLIGTGLRVSPTTLCFDGDTLKQHKKVFSRVFKLSDRELLAVCTEKYQEINLIGVSADELRKIRLN